MSKPPLIASIGTFGSGPAPRVASPAVGLGHVEAEVGGAEAEPPSARTARASPAAARRSRLARRPTGRASGVSAAHGNGPSWQTVAAYSAELSSIDGSKELAFCRSAMPQAAAAVARPGRLDHRGQLGGEAGAEVGADDDREQVDAADRDRLRASVRQRDLPAERLRAELVRDGGHVACEVVGRAGAAAVRAERRSALAGIARSTFASYGSGSSVGRTESSRSRSTWSGWASA